MPAPLETQATTPARVLLMLRARLDAATHSGELLDAWASISAVRLTPLEWRELRAYSAGRAAAVAPSLVGIFTEGFTDEVTVD